MSLLLSRLAVRVPLARSSVRASALRCTRVLPAVQSAWLHVSAAAAAAAPPQKSATVTSVNPVKYTTMIAGIDVVPNGREVLMGLYKETLAAIEAYNKEHGFEPLINQQTRVMTQHRLSICEQEESHAEIERRVWFGQIEQLIEQAEDELDLTVAMNEEVKPWEENAAFRSEMDAVVGPNFGETEEEVKRAASGEPFWTFTEEEKKAEAEYWAPIDAEIREDQKREAEERAARGASKQQQQQK